MSVVLLCLIVLAAAYVLRRSTLSLRFYAGAGNGTRSARLSWPRDEVPVGSTTSVAALLETARGGAHPAVLVEMEEAYGGCVLERSPGGTLGHAELPVELAVPLSRWIEARGGEVMSLSPKTEGFPLSPESRLSSVSEDDLADFDRDNADGHHAFVQFRLSEGSAEGVLVADLMQGIDPDVARSRIRARAWNAEGARRRANG